MRGRDHHGEAPVRAAFDAIFAAANSRLVHVEPARCKQIELAQVRALRFVGPRPPMVRELVRRMEEEPPSEAWVQRVHHTMRRLYKALFDAGIAPDTFRTALNAYLDGQTDLAAQWLDADTLIRPWGER